MAAVTYDAARFEILEAKYFDIAVIRDPAFEVILCVNTENIE